MRVSWWVKSVAGGRWVLIIVGAYSGFFWVGGVVVAREQYIRNTRGYLTYGSKSREFEEAQEIY